MDDPTLSRRDVLRLGAVGITALALPLTISLDAKRASELSENRLPKPYTAVSFDAFKPREAVADAPVDGRPTYRIVQEQFAAQIVPGIATTMWGYRDAVRNPTSGTATFPGPTFRVERGTRIRVEQTNRLPRTHPMFGYLFTTSTHLHGAPSLPYYDGYANDLTDPGFRKTYLYDNGQEGRTLWYHDHAVHHTAENVYGGLAAQYHVLETAKEAALNIPVGDRDVPLIISDVAFRSNGQLLYDDRGDSGPMGDVILVNGRPFPLVPVEARTYRFRILNASVARGYRLQLSNGAVMKLVATDGGLVSETQDLTTLRIGMAERYDVVVDFRPFAGRRVELRNLGVDNSIDYDNTNRVMAFQVAATPPAQPDPEIPRVLPGVPRVMGIDPALATKTVKLRFERQGGEWTINGKTWADVEASRFQDVLTNPALGEVQIWELENTSGGWFHPIHIHLVDFKLLDRNGRPPAPYERAGPKDVVYLGEGEKIRFVTRFEGNSGRYMIHCHNTSHEDHDMMFQFRVGPETAALDPLNPAFRAVPVV